MGPVKPNFKKSKNRKNKVVLVFDEEKRKDFLTGFHKRKLQRKKQAQQKLEEQLKEERKRLKTEARESYKKLVVSHRDIPELENLLSNEYEEDNVTVKVTELSTSEIASRNNWIGENKPIYEGENNENSDENSENESGDSESEEDIPGMELKRKVAKKKTEIIKDKKQEFKTEKDLKRALKKQATKNVQKSKAFQMKNKMERQKQKKKSSKEKRERIKVRSQKNKKRGH